MPQELHPHDPALASEAKYRPSVSTSAFNSLLTRNRTVLPDPGYQRDLEGSPDPEGAGKLQASQGSRHSEVGTEEDAEKPTKKTTMSAGSGAEDQHLCMYSVTSNLLLSLNEPSSLFYLINWTVRKEEKNL